MNFNHYLFDLDGTIVSTKEIHQLAFNDALNFLKFAPISKEDLHIYEALPSYKKIEIYNALNNVNICIEDFLKIKNNFSKERISLSKDLYHPKTYSIFKNIFDNGKKISICSNCSLDSILEILKKANLLHFIEIESIFHNKSCEPKPSPEIYKMAVNSSNIPPEESIIFEDSDKGLQAALSSFTNINVVKVWNPESFRLLF